MGNEMTLQQSLQQSLLDAIREGDFEKVKECIKNGAKVDRYCLDAGGGAKAQLPCVFLKACYDGDVEVVKSLIDAGVDVNERAVETAWAKFPIKPFSVKDQAIVAAFMKNHMEIVKLVLVNAGEVDKAEASDEALKALIAARSQQWVSAHIQQLEDDNKINAVDSMGYTAFVYALARGQYLFAMLLLHSGVELKNAGYPPIFHYIANLESTSIQDAFLSSTVASLVTGSSLASLALLLLAFVRRPTDFLPALLDFVKMVIARAPHLMDRRDEAGRLPHELPWPKELRDLFIGSWAQYHYRELYSLGTTKPNTIKVCVIGDAKAGKTTLVRSLQNIEWQEDDKRTVSIDITAANVESAGDLIFCDFAGQPLFHKTHGLFFSESSAIFLLVVDLTKTKEELIATGDYWASFVKCSVCLSGQACNVVVIGSKKDKLRYEALETAKRTMRDLVKHLQITFGKWFKFHDKFFVLNCRERYSGKVTLLRKIIGDTKGLALKTASDVPAIVQTVQKNFLPVLRNPNVIKQLIKPSEPWRNKFLVLGPFKYFFRIKLRVTDGSNHFANEIRRNTFSLMKSNSLIPNSDQADLPGVRFINASVFKRLMVESVCPGVAESAQNKLVDFLQDIGEILVIDDQVILDLCWLSNNVIGPLVSPEDFPISLECVSGTASKKAIRTVLENFNKREWDNIDDTISLLCNLEICYPFPGQPDMYQFPALIREERPCHVWSKNPKMKVYAGRRLRCKEVTDIITPGTMPFIQSHVHNAPCFRSSEPDVWRGGLLIKRSVNDRSLEGMIVLQDREKAIDFIVRGSEHSEGECKTLLADLMTAGKTIFEKRSPGTNHSLWYISSSELKRLKEDARAHKSKAVNETIEVPEQSTRATVYKEGVEDSLEDLLALPDDHFTFLPYETRCTISKCLKKDSDGREALAKVLLPKFEDRFRCDSAEQLLAIWSTYLEATTKRFADAARASGLLYLLIILKDCSAIKLCEEEEKAAQEDLTFFEANSPSAIATRRLSAATESLAASPPAQDCAAAAIRSQATRSSEVWAGDDYLDASPNSDEKFKVAERIQSVWNRIGRILGPEPFKHYQLHAFGEKRTDLDRAFAMLDAWASEFGRSATRRQLIKAMKRVGCLADAEEVFSGQY
ncbi:death-associated protein kinase 1-like isoform X2 [Oscarella lobularis]|uniref:death-associated protein kinase 1-like isoform X2 n=1 Tax=Oscarella lobularis TaxID=121494 RepID=UPI0033135E16